MQSGIGLDLLDEIFSMFTVLSIPTPVGLDDVEEFVVAERISEDVVDEFVVDETPQQNVVIPVECEWVDCHHIWVELSQSQSPKRRILEVSKSEPRGIWGKPLKNLWTLVSEFPIEVLNPEKMFFPHGSHEPTSR